HGLERDATSVAIVLQADEVLHAKEPWVGITVNISRCINRRGRVGVAVDAPQGDLPCVHRRRGTATAAAMAIAITITIAVAATWAGAAWLANGERAAEANLDAFAEIEVDTARVHDRVAG